MTKPRKAPPKPPGRPTDYTPALGEMICARLLEPDEGRAVTSLRRVCEADDVPHIATVMRWIAKGEAGDETYAEFARMYDVAKELQAEIAADELLGIADTPRAGVKTTTKGDGTVETVETDMIEHRKLQVSTRQWLAEKLRRKRYGAKVEVEGSLGLKVEIVDFGPPPEAG